jgi:hypothetical protein
LNPSCGKSCSSADAGRSQGKTCLGYTGFVVKFGYGRSCAFPSKRQGRDRFDQPFFQFLGIHPSYVTICVCSHIWRAKTSSAKHSLLLQFMFMLEAGQMALSCGPALRASTQEKRLAADLGAFVRQKSCVQQSYVCKWFVSASCRSGNGI